jgi:hypothetical protein
MDFASVRVPGLLPAVSRGGLPLRHSGYPSYVSTGPLTARERRVKVRKDKLV